MREIIFDTETTGLSPETGDRVVEIGAVELINLAQTGRTFHVFVNPERDMPEEAERVHGLSAAFLSKHPVFADPRVGEAFLAFIGDARLVAHNAEFDRKFINAELARIGRPAIPQERCIDTAAMARKKFPGAQASLDALCKRFNISLSSRDKHGALIDSKLLAEVYLELQGGREQKLGFIEDKRAADLAQAEVVYAKRRPRPQPLGPLSTEEERAAHAAFLAEMKDPKWKAFLGE